jgi:ribosome biogenesis ATPase
MPYCSCQKCNSVLGQRHAPCILFIDEIDAITGKRENAQREMERRIVAQLLTCLDGASHYLFWLDSDSAADLSWDKTDNKPVMLLGATNRPDSLDPALRRAGRFDHEIAIGVPDQAARERWAVRDLLFKLISDNTYRILRVLVANLRLSGDFDFTSLAKQTPGYVGADLEALASAAGIIAVKRIFKQLGHTLPNGISQEQLPVPIIEEEAMAVDQPEAEVPALEEITKSLPERPALFASLPPELQQLSIASFLQKHVNPLSEEELAPLSLNNADFILALSQVQPSSKREGFTTVPDVTWDEVGALEDVREELRMSIVQPIRTPELFEALGIGNPCGVLLWGPPGCGKTLVAKAVANESMANFISVKGPELLNKVRFYSAVTVN